MKLDTTTYKMTEPGKLGTVALIIGILGLAASAYGYTVDSSQFYFSYLVAFCFWLAIGLGGLFFTMLHHLTGAKWSTVLRRPSEALMSTLPLMLIFFIPVILGAHDIYHWTHAGLEQTDHLLAWKRPYLNMTFFLLRSAGYFIVWIILSILLYRASIKQDTEPSDNLIRRFRRISAPGMVLFAITVSFSAIDWIMSIDYHWYSTIFGVYVFSGLFLAFLSFMILVGKFQNVKGVLNAEIQDGHYHDLNKLLFAFIIFWAYMAFSQYFLIWYANLPEENVWYLDRWVGSWQTVSLLIIFGHFAAPFVIYLFRASKRSTLVMVIVALWMLFMRFIDLHWLILPNLHEDGAHFGWIDIATMLGVGGIFVWYFWLRYTRRPVLPVGDPTLYDSMHMEHTVTG